MSDINAPKDGSLLRHGSNIGQPISRQDGYLKVTGQAKFAADNNPDGLLHAAVAVSTIAKGRVSLLDVAAAKAHPGVVEVMTPSNRPVLAQDPDVKPGPMTFLMDVLQNDTVRYANQPIAVVIAKTIEAANEGAALLAPQYDVEQAQVSMDGGESFTPPAVGPGLPATVTQGDVDAGLADAVHRIDSQIEIAPHYHNPMEPHCIVAAFEGDRLFIDMPTQGMMPARGRLAGLLGIAPEKIEIRCPFLGGGFGGKGQILGFQILGVLAAQMTGQPVKLVMRREHLYGPTGHRAATRQNLALGLDAKGGLTALKHHTKTTSSRFDDYYEAAGSISQSLYATPALHTSHEGVRIDSGTPTFMRAPGEAGGSLALEIAMDEAAYAIGMDPLEFRLENYAEVDPKTNQPFSSKALRECYHEAAQRFGWADRPLEPGQMRDSSGLLVGWGVGTAQYPAHIFSAEAIATLRNDGTATMKSGLHDMGQGSWTALSQIAADSLGLSMDDVTLEYGSTNQPNAGLGGASAHTSTVGLALDAAGAEILDQLVELAIRDEGSPLFGAGNSGLIAREGRLHRRDDESRSESYQEIMMRTGQAEITGSGTGGANPAHGRYSMFAHGAVFAEVKVDPDLGQIRTTRVVGGFAIGRVINPKLVQSQLNGGAIWGASMALHEGAVMDTRSGRVMNANLGDYLIPVNADIPDLDVFTVDEFDPYINSLGMKGAGEIAVTGTAGAIANAVWHATGKRARRFPIGVGELI